MNEPQAEAELAQEEFERICEEEKRYYIQQGINECGAEY